MSLAEFTLPITVHDAAILVLFTGWILNFWLRYTSKIIRFVIFEGTVLTIIIALSAFILKNHAGDNSILRGFFLQGRWMEFMGKVAKWIFYHSAAA